jgi:predicted ATPase
VAYALIFAACIRQLRGEGHTAQEYAEKAIVFCREQEFPVWLAFGLVVRGWALTAQGREEEGIAQIRQGLTAWKATGAEASRPLVLALLAEAQGRVGQAEEGLNLLEEALAIAYGNEERYFEAELHRLNGELTLQSRVQGRASSVHNPQSAFHKPQSEAEACFLKAIEIARRQSMKSLELRAIMSLSRLWRQQGKTEEARQMLAEIYGWFTEGFETADLQAAKTLLAERERP